MSAYPSLYIATSIAYPYVSSSVSGVNFDIYVYIYIKSYIYICIFDAYIYIYIKSSKLSAYPDVSLAIYIAATIAYPSLYKLLRVSCKYYIYIYMQL